MVKVIKVAPVSKGEALSVFDSKAGPFTTEKGNGEALINFAAKGVAAKPDNGGCPYLTFPQLLKKAVDRCGDKPALGVESPVPALVNGKAPPAAPRDQWKTWTYKQYYEDASRLAKGCISVGHKQHDAVCIFGFNSPEWLLSEVGAMMAGGKAAGVYPSDTSDQLAFKAKHSDASVAFLEGENELNKFKEVLDEVPYLKAIVSWSCDAGVSSLKRKDGSTVKVMTFAALLEAGSKVEDSVLEERMALIKPSHCCSLVYTSGTTGNPKAVMLSHDSIIFEASSVAGILPFIGAKNEQERVLSYLPLSHVAGMLIDIIFPVVISASKRPGYVTTYFARPYDLKAGSLKDRLQCVRPTFFLGVPRVWEKIMFAMKAIGASIKGAKKKISTWAKAKGLTYQQQLQIGGAGNKPFMYGLAEKLVHNKVKDNLGLDECKFMFAGAAPCTKEVLEYFGQLGININEAYGMSECTGAVTFNTDPCHQWGTIGYAIPGCEVKIFKVDPSDINKKTECPRAKDIFSATDEEQGEICFRGRNTMMGYLANPKFGAEHVAEIQKKNADAVDAEGWLHSGDMGAISRKNMVKITGRYKELIITAGGENVAPVPIEDEIKRLCEAVSNVVMIGDKRKFNIALVTLKAVGATGELPGGDTLEGAAASVLPGIASVTAAINSPAYAKSIEKAIVATNKNGKVCPSNAAKIQKFMVLPRDFSVTTDELTATLKLKRGTVMTKYAESIEQIYASSETYVKYEGPIPEASM